MNYKLYWELTNEETRGCFGRLARRRSRVSRQR